MASYKEPDTWLQSEEHAYPHGGQTRKGRALFADGKYRRVYAGIPDTFFTIPAHARIGGSYVAGYLTCDDGTWRFHEYTKREADLAALGGNHGKVPDAG